MEISYHYVKLRKDFGRHPNFQDTPPKLLVDQRPDEESAKHWIGRGQVDTGVQAAPVFSEHEVNTATVVQATKSVYHVEGGWPKDVDHTEADQVIRFRKKVEKDEEYIRCVARLGAVAEGLVKQNNVIDIYEDYFTDVPSQRLFDPPSTRTVTVLRDPSAHGDCGPRGAQAVSWHPDGSARLAVAYSHLEGAAPGSAAHGDGAPSHVWDVSNPAAPEASLAAHAPLTAIGYNAKDHSLIGAGQANGQFVFFDVRRGAAPVEATPIEHSHRDAVLSFAWTLSKSGGELMSCSTDGSVLWWDLRRLSEPLEAVELRERGAEGGALAGTVVEYSAAAGLTKFMVGTEQGTILSGNRKVKTPAERVTGSFVGHHGAVAALARSPHFPKYFLSLGDWAPRLWSEELRSPILTCRYGAAHLTAGGWSPSRPGVFFAAGSEGALEAWDLFYKQREPVLTVQVSNRALTAFAMQAGAAPRLAGVGCAGGSVTVLQLSEGLVAAQPNEKATISAVFERESSREKNLEKGAREAKIRARKEAARGADPIDRVTEEDLAQVEKDFFSLTAA